MTTSRIDYLVQQALAGKATPEEWEEFQQMVMQQRETAGLEQALEKNWQQFHPGENVPEQQLDDIFSALMQHKEELPPARIIQWGKWIWAAASILLISIVGMYYYFSHNKPVVEVAETSPLIEPGKDGAILTLNDGSTIVLDTLSNGVVSSQGGMNVLLKNQELIYHSGNTSSQNPSSVAYNTLTTPKGRQFTITLPDGTRVWLNAASSLKFPTSFTGPERLVNITGEAFFEVAKDQQTPFIVQAPELSIRVLGTTFNINAYPNETGITTTLLEGRVQITKGTVTKNLQPGQQLISSGTNELVVHDDVNIDQVIAWKNGFFNFEGVGIQNLMRQLERWYNIEVVYPQGVPSIEFVGKMSRNISLPDLLDGLKGAGVNFRIEKNRQLIVMP